MNEERPKAILAALAAAALYGLNAPLSKLLLAEIPAALMASLLYLGAGFGMLLIRFARSAGRRGRADARITRADLPYVSGMVLLDAAAPILLMTGLSRTSPANAALLGNFEIVATSLIAFLAFREHVGWKMWIAIALITAASVILSFEGAASLSFGAGSAFILLATVSWGLENNCTRMLSLKDPLQIVVIKGLGSGAVSLGLALFLGQSGAPLRYMAAALALGFVCYGLSIALYVLAQRRLGAARTSAYYAVAPFVGVALSAAIFGQRFEPSFALALLIMIAGTCFAASERHRHAHMHEALAHEHRHSHADGHHAHAHDGPVSGEHSHFHIHEPVEHTHGHTPDLHHNHPHG